ncbi:hypothetical protein DRP05_05965 [Archaeoglobales archaeon]|nr:MAG: hypothetical protein DRP05_05965 [Archaeoglobales archaeon]
MNKSKKVFLIELKTLEPVTITSNKGKSKFIESLKYIPASSILGAVSRQVILENIADGVGQCSRILSPDVIPDCDNCKVTKCKYRILWKEKNLKLTHAVVGEWGIDALGVVNLQSIGVLREKANGEGKRDLLLCLFVEQKERLGRLRPRILLDETINSSNYKKKPGDIVGHNIAGEDGAVEVEMIQFGRVSIDYKFKTSKEGQLYGFTAIKERQKFRFIVVAQEELEDCFDSEVKIGAWKSRGMGLVKMRRVNSWNVEDYIEERSKQILTGFERINDVLRNYGIDGWYGTYTFLTDCTSKDIGFKQEYQIHRIRRLRRYERRNDGSYFILRDVILAGSVGVFSVNEPEENSQKLAEIEIKLVEEPWFDWIFFNHPVHYEKSSLEV